MPRNSLGVSRGPVMAEMPKSARTGRRYTVNKMFAGLISRWMMPARCAVSTAPAMRMAVSSVSGIAMTFCLSRIPSCGGGQYSMTMKGRPSADTPAPKTDRIAGCEETLAMRLASDSNREAELPATSVSMTLTATSRRGMCCS